MNVWRVIDTGLEVQLERIRVQQTPWRDVYVCEEQCLDVTTNADKAGEWGSELVYISRQSAVRVARDIINERIQRLTTNLATIDCTT